MLPLALFTAILVPSTMAYTRCITCATPGLRNNWLMTGIEKPPAGLAFVDGCGTLPDGAGSNFQASSFTTQCDSNYCLEMSIPTDQPEQVEFLRGCYDKLIADGNTAGLAKEALSGSGLCHLYKFDQKRLNYVHYCMGETDTTDEPNPAACNFRIKFSNSSKTVTETIPKADSYTCNALNSVECVTCTRTDGVGKCDSSTTGTKPGPLCVKVRGMVNGREFEERGPSFIPPFAASSWDKCGIVSTLNSTTYLGPASGTSGGQSLRRKRSLKQLFGGTKCYCKDNKCNGSPMMAGLPATLLLLLTAVPFFS